MDTARTRRLMLAELFIFLTLAGTTALVFQPLMSVINSNIDVVRKGIVSQAEAILNRSIRYRSMNPSLIGTIEIRTLTVGDQNNPLVASERLFIEYSMWDLLRGRASGAVRTLILENPVFSYDRDRDGDLKTLFSGGHGGELRLPPECVVVVQNGSMLLSRGKTVFSATGISLEGRIDEELIALDGVWMKNSSVAGAVTTEGSINGSFSRDLTRGNLAISLDSVEAEGFTVDRIGFDLSFLEDRIIFEREADGFPLELFAEYLHDSGNISASFRADSFPADSMIHLRGSAEKYAPLLALNLSGGAEFNLSRSTGLDSRETLAYRFSLSGTGSGGEKRVRSFTVAGEGDDHAVRFSNARLDARRGFARYSGVVQFTPLRSQGVLLFEDFSLTGDGGVNGTVSFSEIDHGLGIYSASLSFGDTTLSPLSGTIVLEEGVQRYDLGFNSLRDDEDGSVVSSFTTGGTFAARPPGLEGNLSIRNWYASDILAMLRPFSPAVSPGVLAEQTRFSADIVYSTDFSHVSYNSPLFRAEHSSGTLLSVSIDGSENRLVLSEGTIQKEDDRLDFGLNADFSDQEDISFACDFAYLDYQYDFEASLREGSIFTLRSNHDVSATLRKEENRWSGSALGRRIPLPFRKQNAYLDLDTVFSYTGADSWTLDLNQFEIRESEGSFFLSLRGGARENGMNLERIYYTDGAGPLEGSAAAVWDHDFSVIDGSFFLSGEDQTETLAGSVFYEPGNLEFQGNLSGFNGTRIGMAGSNVRMSGEVSGGLSGEGYYLVNLSLNSLTGTFNSTDVSLSGFALLDPEQLILSQIQYRAGAIQTTIPYVSMDRNAGRLETEATISGVVNEQELGVLVSLGINFQPMRTWFDTESLEAFSGILDVRHAYINQKETTEPFSFAFTRTPLAETGTTGEPNPAVYRISGGPRDMLYAEFLEDVPGSGVFSLSLGNPSPVQCFITGTLEGTTIDALATEVFVDLEELWEVIPITKIVNFTGGTITGETRIFGSIFDPEFDGTAWGSGITLRVPDYVPEEIGPGSGMITFVDNGFSFGPIVAPCGDGRGILNAWIGFTRWLVSFDLTIDVDQNIPFDFNLMGIMAKGSARGRINLLMEEEALVTITGNVEADDTEMTIDQEEIERSMADEGSSDDAEVAADVRITTGRRVEFLWPNSSTPLLRAYGESRAGVRIMADTRVPTFTMDGNVLLRGGELYHLQRSFYIKEGVLQFNGNAPTFDPLITARAEVRDNNDEGPVIITMIMENVPLSELELTMPRYQSTPSLSQVEIYSLLGQAPSADAPLTAESLNPLLSSTTEMILQTVIFRRAEQVIRNALGLDMFSFRTQILQNALFEAIRNREPEEQPATMGNYLDNTTVFIGKYIGQELFFQGILSFRYDQYQEQYGGMRFEPEIGFDLRTPLFDVRWSLQPSYTDSLLQRFRETLFVADQSISLLWRWSL